MSFENTRNPIRAELLPAQRHQIPYTRLSHQPVGVDQPLHLIPDGKRAAVGQNQLPILPYGLLNRIQMGHWLIGLEPPARIQVDTLADQFFIPAARSGQRRAQLEHGRFKLLADAQIGQRPRDTQHKQRADLVFGQARQVRMETVEQRTAAAAAPLRVNRDSGGAQRVEGCSL